MRFGLSLLALSMLAAAGNAQLPGLIPSAQGMQQKDNDIEFTSRSSLPGTQQGRLSTHLLAGQWAGVRAVRAFELAVQDQNDATSEAFVIEIRAQDPTTSYPDWPSGAPAVFTGNYNTPAGTGVIAAWLVAFTPATPVTLPGGANGAGFYMAVQVPINSAWVNDGASVHMSAGLNLPCGTSGNPGCCGSVANPTLGGWESPKGVPVSQTNIMNVSPADTPALNINFASRDRNYKHWIQCVAPTLRNLAIDPTAGSAWFCPISNPNAGHAAIMPDINDFLGAGRRDRLGWRVNGGPTYAGGLGFVFLSRNCLETPIPVPGIGDLYVDFADVLFTALIQGPVALGAADGVGVLQDNFVPGNEAVIDGIGSLHCQAVAINSTFSAYELTNMSTFSFTLAGGTSFTADAANPVTIPITSQSQIRLKNNGFGNLRAEFRNGTTVLGTMTVRENTTGAGFITPGSNNVVIATTNTNPYGNNPSAGSYLLQ